MGTFVSGCMEFSLLESHTPSSHLLDNRKTVMRESMYKNITKYKTVY